MQHIRCRRNDGDGRGQFRDGPTGATQSVSSSNRRTRTKCPSLPAVDSARIDEMKNTTASVGHRRRRHAAIQQQQQQQPSLGRSRRRSQRDDTASQQRVKQETRSTGLDGDPTSQRTNNGDVYRWPEITTATPRHFIGLRPNTGGRTPTSTSTAVQHTIVELKPL